MTSSTSELGPRAAWVMAARPKTLYAAVAPVIVGSAVALAEGRFQLLPAVAALLGAVLIQIGANLANDVFDYEKGADTAGRLGPVRVTEAGLLSPKQVQRGMWLTFGLAALAGIYLTSVAGWPVLLIGILSIAAGIAYTGGPFPLGYHGLGDLFVFVFFGLVAVGGAYFVQARTLSSLAIWSAVPVGLIATALLGVNNLRDIETDRRAGKRTLAVRLGAQATRRYLLVLLTLAYLWAVIMVIAAAAPPGVLLTGLSLPHALSVARQILQKEGRALNRVLGATSQLEILYSLLLAAGLLLGR